MRWQTNRHGSPQDPDPRWAERLETVGMLLDQDGDAVRDVAVVTQGEQIIVSALMLRLSSHHSGWIPITFGVTRDAVVPIETLLANG